MNAAPLPGGSFKGTSDCPWGEVILPAISVHDRQVLLRICCMAAAWLLYDSCMTPVWMEHG
jgi:hypothetical protein